MHDLQGKYRPASINQVLQAARRVLSSKICRGSTVTLPDVVKDFVHLQFGRIKMRAREPHTSFIHAGISRCS